MGTISLTVFDRNSNSMENSPCCNSASGLQIATKFCTCHDSTAVVTCTKLCSDHCIRIEVTVKQNFHRIWIGMEKPLVKRGPVSYFTSILPMFIQFVGNYSTFCTYCITRKQWVYNFFSVIWTQKCFDACKLKPNAHVDSLRYGPMMLWPASLLLTERK